MNEFQTAIKKYAEFSGRSSRKDYWMFVLFFFLISLVLSILDAVIGTRSASGLGLLSGLFTLAVFVPYLAINSRRLHDTGKSGWMQLLFAIPLVGFILWIVFMVQDSDRGANKYGPSPQAGGATVPEGGPAPA